MIRIEIKHLKLIQTIAETENITRAAHRLYVSQPALSRRLLEIEERLGTRLFHRSKKRMTLTPEGSRLLKSADVIMDELRTAELEISKIVNGETGQLRIGVSCLFCFQWLPEVVAGFQRHYPKVDLALSTCRDVVADLRNNTFDMVVTAHPVETESVSVVALFEDEMVAVTAPDHPLHSRRYLTAADFSESKLIVSSHMPLEQFARAIWPGTPLTPLAVMHIDLPNAIIELVKAGLGVSFAPRWAVRSYLDSGQLAAVALDARGIHPVWKVVYPAGERLPAFRQAFIDQLLARGCQRGGGKGEPGAWH